MSCSSPDRDPRETAALRALLASKIGFDPDVLGPAFLESVMRRCEQSGDMQGWRQFLQSASAGGPDWERLLQEIVVSETWFFRDEQPFESIAERVSERWRQGRGAPSRIFSCPCSTGEEPYSIAIALTDAGLPGAAFHIEAADVSPDAVRRARAGRFAERSFRGNKRNLAGYFIEGEDGRRELKAELRRMVHFRVANLLDLSSVELAPYDIVLCRNLLIYLHEDARQVVMSILQAVLADDGILIVGHAEAALALQQGFRPVGDPGAFAFAPGKASSTALVSRPVRGAPPTETAAEIPSKPVPGHSLTEIRELADQGQVEAAVHACDLYVRQQPVSAEAYYLLGVLLGATNDEAGSENAFRRALYVEPDHAGALEHLALAQDGKGNTVSAHRLRARVRVAAERSVEP